MTRWKIALIAGALLVMAAGGVKALQPAATGLIVRTVPLGEIYLRARQRERPRRDTVA